MTHKDIDWKDAVPQTSQIPDDLSWQQAVNTLFGGGTPEIPKKTTRPLTDREREYLRADCRCWVDPMRFMVYKNAVIRYVKTHRSGFDYAVCYGLYDDPTEALEAILNSDEYQAYLGWNAKIPSNAGLVSAMIKDGLYEFGGSDHIASKCEAAIAYWHKTQKGES